MTTKTPSQLRALMTQAHDLLMRLSSREVENRSYRFTDRYYQAFAKACQRHERRAKAFNDYFDNQADIEYQYWLNEDSAVVATTPLDDSAEVVQPSQGATLSSFRFPPQCLKPCEGTIIFEYDACLHEYDNAEKCVLCGHIIHDEDLEPSQLAPTADFALRYPPYSINPFDLSLLKVMSLGSILRPMITAHCVCLLPLKSSARR